MSWPKNPTNMTGLEIFLRLCNFFRRFVPNLTHISAIFTINPQLGKSPSLPRGRLNKIELALLEALQQLLWSPQILALPRPNQRYEVDTHAWDKQFAGVLLHEQPERPRDEVITGHNRIIRLSSHLTQCPGSILRSHWPCFKVTQFTIRTGHDALWMILTWQGRQ